MSIDNVNNTSDSPLASVDDAAEAILGQWEDADEDQLSEDSQEATDESTDETDVEESEETEDETEDEESDEETEDPDEELEETEDSDEESEDDDQEVEEIDLSDDTLVEITVDGESKQASIKDLKRLYGQEASLTRKSQEAASQRKLADDQLQKADASLQAMLSRAQERYKPYSEVDMLVASKQMDAESFTALRAEAKQAEDDLKFLSEEADQFYSFVKQQQAEAKQAEAKECIKVLQKEIPDWNNDLYNDIRSYAIGQGLPEEAVNQYSDPNVIMLLNKARMFDQTKKVATAKKAKASKKILRSKKAPPTKADIKAQRQKKTMDKLRSGGNDLDNIADAIMAGWE
jgi:phosphotransferase system HPr-like phosphotransfer protein